MINLVHVSVIGFIFLSFQSLYYFMLHYVKVGPIYIFHIYYLLHPCHPLFPVCLSSSHNARNEMKRVKQSLTKNSCNLLGSQLKHIKM